MKYGLISSLYDKYDMTSTYRYSLSALQGRH